jgi:hypothetical protein
MLKSRDVLQDCKHAVELLEQESHPDTFRVLYVAAVALARAVGHVLQKVDAKLNDRLSSAVAAAYEDWKSQRAENRIFWDFIEEERNQVLKQYELGFFAGPINVMAGREIHRLDEHLFCPITSGPFAGEDCRDVLHECITWWEEKLARIDSPIA